MYLPADALAILRDNVCFIEIKNTQGFKQIGTGFVVGVEQNEILSIYLVTCEHVVHEELANGNNLFVSLNSLKKPRTEHVLLPIKWIFHPTKGNMDMVDLAVLPLEQEMFAGQRVEFVVMAEDMMSDLARAKAMGITLHEGNPIMFMGSFENWTGFERNYPLFRFGRIALVPGEQMPGVEARLGMSDYFLVESTAYRCMSGAPVYVEVRHNGKERITPAGVMAGLFTEDEMVVKKYTHYGISQVIPIQKLSEIIYGEELVSSRSKKTKEQDWRRGVN